MGDFNMPTDSGIYQQFWSDFQDAHSKAGFGLGSTKKTRWFGIRIDHILAGSEWKILRSWVATPAQGSDHAPLVADLRLRDG
jgi:endonuclease/exonuclease/phosphatase family metal-dependent hydrolase